MWNTCINWPGGRWSCNGWFVAIVHDMWELETTTSSPIIRGSFSQSSSFPFFLSRCMHLLLLIWYCLEKRLFWFDFSSLLSFFGGGDKHGAERARYSRVCGTIQCGILSISSSICVSPLNDRYASHFTWTGGSYMFIYHYRMCTLIMIWSFMIMSVKRGATWRISDSPSFFLFYSFVNILFLSLIFLIWPSSLFVSLSYSHSQSSTSWLLLSLLSYGGFNKQGPS